MYMNMFTCPCSQQFVSVRSDVTVALPAAEDGCRWEVLASDGVGTAPVQQRLDAIGGIQGDRSPLPPSTPPLTPPRA